MNKHLEKDPHINFNKPVIDVFIYDVLEHNMSSNTNSGNYVGNQFNEIHINKEEKGKIYPSKITFKKKNEVVKKNFIEKKQVNNKIYSNDILTSNKKANNSKLLNFLKNENKSKYTILTSNKKANISNSIKLPNKNKYTIKDFYNLYIHNISYNSKYLYYANKYFYKLSKDSFLDYMIYIIDKASNINIQRTTIKADPEDKILIFGNFKGNFHSFFRILVRLHLKNIINLNTFKITDNYKLIFLGDFLPCKYPLEILYIFSQFIINNSSNNKNNKIYIISSYPIYYLGQNIRLLEETFLKKNTNRSENSLNYIRRHKYIKKYTDAIYKSFRKLIRLFPNEIDLTLNDYKYFLTNDFDIRYFSSRNSVINEILRILKKYDYQFIICGEGITDYLYESGKPKNASLYGIKSVIDLNDSNIQKLNPDNDYIYFPKKNNSIGSIATIDTVNWINYKKKTLLNKITKKVLGSVIDKSNVTLQTKKNNNSIEQIFPLLMLSSNNNFKKDSYIMLHIPNQNKANQNNSNI
jgi:hypothetical protein